MRAVVLVSGGMDSLVTAATAVAEGRECAFLHVTYGQRTAARERRAFDEISRFYKPYKTLVADIGYLAAIGGSALTDATIPVPTSDETGLGLPHPSPSPGGRGICENGDRHQFPEKRGNCEPVPIFQAGTARGSTELAGVRAPTPSTVPVTYVPFRNAHLVAIATSLAEVGGAGEIYIGATQVDYSGYPDCRREFFDALEKAIEVGTRPETYIRIVTPVISMTKADIVREGMRLGAPFELSWSCYTESERACGRCESCVLRLKGFAEAGVRDPIGYASK